MKNYRSLEPEDRLGECHASTHTIHIDLSHLEGAFGVTLRAYTMQEEVSDHDHLCTTQILPHARTRSAVCS